MDGNSVEAYMNEETNIHNSDMRCRRTEAIKQRIDLLGRLRAEGKLRSLRHHPSDGDGSMKIVTKYDPPPIPVRQMDWTAVSSDYDAGDPIGYGATEAEAIADLQERLEMEAEDA